MAMLAVGVVRESGAQERRVAVVPADVGALTGAGMVVLVESGAGARAFFSDDAYGVGGAEVVAAAELYARADVVACVNPPGPEVIRGLRRGQVVVGGLGLHSCPDRIEALAGRGVVVLSFDGLPRTASRAQGMDALTSQSNVAGYKAVLVAASEFGRFFPMLVTAAGTARPARVLVLGAGVAGLAAIGTARRLGAVVSAYDVRPTAREEVRSMGATFVDLAASFGGAAGGGYARELTEEERLLLPQALAPHVARADVVITTAQVPGRIPPLLVTEEAIKAMGPGSVLVDLAAGPDGGNVALSRPGRTIVTDEGVTVVGGDNLPATVPTAASTAYSRNVSALLRYLVRDGVLVLDENDDIVAGLKGIRR